MPEGTIVQRITLKDAASLLGISEAGVRARLRRGALEGERDGNGKLWVFVETAATEHPSAQEEADEPSSFEAVDDAGGVAAEDERPALIADGSEDGLAGIVARLDRIEALLVAVPDAATARASAIAEERDELRLRVDALESLLDIAARDHSAKLDALTERVDGRRFSLGAIWSWLCWRASQVSGGWS